LHIDWLIIDPRIYGLMNPCIPNHKVVIVARLNYIWEWSIHYCSLSAMFTSLHSSTNQELFKKHVCNHSSYYENTMVPLAPVIVWNWSIYCPSLSSMFDLLHSSTNQEVFEKHLCNKSSHYEKYGRFLITQRKPSHATT